MIENLRPLTQEQLQGVRKRARDAVIPSIGPKPTREQFTPYSHLHVNKVRAHFLGAHHIVFAMITCVMVSQRKFESVHGKTTAVSRARSSRVNVSLYLRQSATLRVRR
jgi:hypothetical protein